MSSTIECMFCLEPGTVNVNPLQCGCTIHYHPQCYMSWVKHYGATCPMCRKIPVPQINPETMELEFIIENVNMEHNVDRHPDPNVDSQDRKQSHMIYTLVCCVIILVTLLIVVGLNSFHMI